MASINDVARAAGVSTATVSRVLANKSTVRPETRQRVLKAVDELNYRPNLIARSLRAQKSAIIGLVVSDIRNPFFTAIGRSVEDTAYESGYTVLMCNTDENPDKEMLYLNILHDENVAGIIFSPTYRFSTSGKDIKPRTPFVFIDRSVNRIDADMVLLDNAGAAYDLACHLIENNHKKIVGLFGNASTTGKQRHQGLQKALKDHQLQPAEAHFIEPRIKHGYNKAMEILAKNHLPDAIFTSNSLLTAGAYQAILDSNLSIPDDVALVGFDETTWGALVNPPITVIAQPTEEIGRTATELLFQRIANPDRAYKTVVLKGRLLVRGSSAKKAGQ